MSSVLLLTDNGGGDLDDYFINVYGYGFVWRLRGMGSVGQMKSFGGRLVAMLANGGQFASSNPSGPVADVRAAPEVRTVS